MDEPEAEGEVDKKSMVKELEIIDLELEERHWKIRLLSKEELMELKQLCVKMLSLQT